MTVQRGLHGLADAFHHLGASAVVTMQGAIESRAAVAFAEAVYLAIGRAEPIDVAVACARRAIANVTSLDRRDWALPVLTLRAPPDGVVPLRASQPTELVDQFERVRAFVDRGHQRRTLWWGVDPDERTPQHMLVVTGEPQVGKTSLVYACLLTCARRGRPVRYVTLSAQRNRTWLDVVRAVANGTGSSPIQQPLPEPALSQFNHDLNRLLQGLDREPLMPGAVVVDEGWQLQNTSERTGDHIAVVFNALQDALRTAAGGEPFIVAFDDLAGVLRQDFSDYVWPLLLRPILAGEREPVRAIIVVSEYELSALLPPEAHSLVHPVLVKPFAGVEFVRLVREYCARKDIDFTSRWETIATATAEGLAQWKPGQLGILEQLVTGGVGS